jgi:hypothetical protein
MILIDHLPDIRPGIERIAEHGGMSRRQAIYELQRLEELGVIRIERKFGRGNQYHLADGWENVLPVQGVHPCSTCTSAQDAPLPVHHVHGGSAARAPLPVHHVHPKTELKTEVKSRETRARTAAPKSGSRSSKAKSQKPTETLMPPDWQPTAEHIAFAAEHTEIDLAIEVVKFKGHFDGQKLASWNGRFATWLGNAVTFAKRDAARGGPRRVQPVQRDIVEGLQLAMVES